MAENSQQLNGDKAEKKKTFNWLDEETALLLQVVLAYKTTKLSEGKDWETICAKYEDIKQNFALQYPNEVSEEFPRGEAVIQELTKERTNTKIKKVKNSFRKAVASGKRSGGGRVVYSLHDKCYQIWAGCPAAECVDDGIETEFVNNSEDKNNVETNMPAEPSDSINNMPEKDSDSAEEDNIIEPIKKKMKQIRDTMMVDLRAKRNSRSIKQVGFQDQMLAQMKEEAEISKEELKIQKEIAEQLRNSEKQFVEAMQAISANVNTTMNQGFGMIQQMLQQTSTNYWPQYQQQRNSWQQRQATINTVNYEQFEHNGDDSICYEEL
eukprot:gene2288-2633_t